MTELILIGLVAAVYVLGCMLAREFTDVIEELDNEYLPRPYHYWKFILMWPISVIRGSTGEKE